MSIVVAVTDSAEGRAALQAAADEAIQRRTGLVVVDLTGGDLDTAALGSVTAEVVVPERSPLDEVEQVLQVIADRPDADRLVVGVRRRSPVGKAVLGSIPQRLIMEATVPVLSVRAAA